MSASRRILVLGVVAAVALVGVVGAVWVREISATNRGAAISSPAPTPSGTPSTRIPFGTLAQHGIQVTVVDQADVPAGSAVSRQDAETVAAKQFGSGTDVLESTLASVTGLGRFSDSHLCWVVAVDPAGGARSGAGIPYNYLVVFVDAGSGEFIEAEESTDQSLPPLAHNGVSPSATAAR